MKRIQSLLLVLLSFGIINAQDWQPVHSNKSYNYKLGISPIITHVIRVDSTQINDDETVLYLNRVVTQCDTCQNLPNRKYALKNQPQFLNKKIINLADTAYLFLNKNGFVIFPFRNTGETWIFDTLKNITAEITYTGIHNFLDLTDSIKRISLSNGERILLSKNHGIIEYPNQQGDIYVLAGIEEGQNVTGEKYPGFWEFLDFKEGDLIQRGNWRSTEYDNQETITQYDFLSRSKTDSSLIYDVKKYWRYEYFYYNQSRETSAGSKTEKLIYEYVPDDFINGYPGEIFEVNKIIDWEPYIKVYIICYVYLEDGILVKSSLLKDSDSWLNHFYQDPLHKDLLATNSNYSFYNFEYNYKEGMGYTEVWDDFENGSMDIFMGRVRNNDTIGTIYPLDFFSHIDAPVLEDKHIHISPNPAQLGDIITVQPESEFENFILFTITGEKIKSGIINKGIPTDELAPGIYLLMLNHKKGPVSQKIVLR